MALLRGSLLALLVLGGVHDVLGAPPQVPLGPAAVAPAAKPRKLTGRFLHLTDIHPDPHYREGMSEKSACHRKKPKKKPRSGPFGYTYGECDSPLLLTNYTLDYLESKWADEVDFVIWTGDSARHDNDRKIPRTLKEIYALNRVMARRMEEIFTSRGIPVIPSIGNNDVWPHNIMMPGPNDVTSEFSSIWKSFVPFHSYQVFQRGAYYSVEVIPDQLAVISLNTMYLFDSNKAVGGCEVKDRDDPGNLQLDWMEVQLQAFRARGMQTWISGHVPPSARNFHSECHIRYTELSLRYQDTILGHLFGHMNVDHFFFLDARTLASEEENDGGAHTAGKHKDLYATLLKDYDHLYKREKDLDYDSISVVNVAPSVVPNPYLPSFRIFSYNITGSRYSAGLLGDSGTDSGVGQQHHLGDFVDREELCQGPDASNVSWRCNLNSPWHSSPHSPSRTNRLYTPLGFAQYYMPNLTGTERHPPKWKLEYLTYAPQALHPPAAAGEPEAGKKKDAFVYPVPLKRLPRKLRDANVTASKFAPYAMSDLTIPSWTALAHRLAKAGGRSKLRKRFRRYMYMGANEEL
ncbi:endopolyphosphatase [Phanerochaete sordida]|uniref:Endopolyphosphatase n=1 Tax=Phanerochaete sordida TaxID=48140 RepID=A0A9P3FVT7_9APHY|nr:endopolyphosphatase [Phanerochaete sordida]